MLFCPLRLCGRRIYPAEAQRLKEKSETSLSVFRFQRNELVSLNHPLPQVFLTASALYLGTVCAGEFNLEQFGQVWNINS
jgi:hypothetical protein